MSAHLLVSHKVRTSFPGIAGREKTSNKCEQAGMRHLAHLTSASDISFTFFMPAKAEGRKWLYFPSKIWSVLAMFMVVIWCPICLWHLQLQQSSQKLLRPWQSYNTAAMPRAKEVMSCPNYLVNFTRRFRCWKDRQKLFQVHCILQMPMEEESYRAVRSSMSFQGARTDIPYCFCNTDLLMTSNAPFPKSRGCSVSLTTR